MSFQGTAGDRVAGVHSSLVNGWLIYRLLIVSDARIGDRQGVYHLTFRSPS